MALSTGVELAMGGEDEDAIGSVQYMCIAVMAVTVSSYKLLELSVATNVIGNGTRTGSLKLVHFIAERVWPAVC